jgi:excisionase family DNA binding protein
MPSPPADLLSLSDAAALLGVHPVTLRRWADQGDVLVMVTPGGHRRFPRTEIERLMGVEAASLAAEDGEQQAILDEVRQIGQAYADDARAHDLGLIDVLRAVTFFRDQTIEGVLSADATASDPQAGRRAIQRVNAFFNAILLAAAAAFD